jgi:hypothetical protein
MACQLFDAFVGTILNYSSEVWGYTKSKEVERIHLKFCKRILNVNKTTSSMGVYGELGRYPLFIKRYLCLIKYWFKLLKTDNVILQYVYKQSLEDDKRGRKNWVSNIRKLLHDYGFGYVWINPQIVNINCFLQHFKQKVIDCFLQTWHASKENSSVLEVLNTIKHTFEYESYLDKIPNTLRFYLTRIRISAHSLRVQTGRYEQNRTPRDRRVCLCCNNGVLENEYHFIIQCTAFDECRSKYIDPYFHEHGNIHKFRELLSLKDKNTAIKLALFIKEALNIRYTMLNSTA